MATATLAPSPTESDVTERARLLQLFDVLAALGEPTHCSLHVAVYPLAPEMLRLWVGSRDGYYAEQYFTAFGECMTIVRKDTCQALVHVYFDGEVQ